MKKEFDIIILTDSRYVDSTKTDTYNQNVLREDNYVLKDLQTIGLRVSRKAWSDESFDWKTTKYILFRSTWDYFDRFDEFSIWLNKVSKQTKLLNSENIIRWNMDKHYLLDIQQKGVHVIPSVYVEKKSETTLKQLFKEHHFYNTILKPCVSGGARHTYKLTPSNLINHENIFQELISKEAIILQPFQNSIVEKGEISLMVIAGKYTHAVLKKAKKGDFRVQDDWGGTVQPYTPSPQEIEFAEKAVNSSIEKPIYARVDIAEDNNGLLALMELELIEPELWFRNNPQAATLLAKAIKTLV